MWHKPSCKRPHNRPLVAEAAFTKCTNRGCNCTSTPSLGSFTAEQKAYTTPLFQPKAGTAKIHCSQTYGNFAQCCLGKALLVQESRQCEQARGDGAPVWHCFSLDVPYRDLTMGPLFRQSL